MSLVDTDQRPPARAQRGFVETVPGWVLGASMALSLLFLMWLGGVVFLKAGEFLHALNLFLSGVLVAPVAGVLTWTVCDIVDGLRYLEAFAPSRPCAPAGGGALRLIAAGIRVQGAGLAMLVVLRHTGVDIDGSAARLVAGGATLDLVLRLSTGAIVCAAFLLAVFRLIVSLGRGQVISGDKVLIVAFLVSIPGAVLAVFRPHLAPGFGLLVALLAATTGFRRLKKRPVRSESLAPMVALTAGAVLVGMLHAVAVPMLPPVLAFFLAPLVPPPLVEVFCAGMHVGESVLGPALWLVAAIVAAVYLTALWRVAAGLSYLAGLGGQAVPPSRSAEPVWNATRVSLAAGSLGALTLTGGLFVLAEIAIWHFSSSVTGLTQVSVVSRVLLGWLASLDSGQIIIHLAMVWVVILGLPAIDMVFSPLAGYSQDTEARPLGTASWPSIGAAILLAGAIGTSISVLTGGIMEAIGLGAADSTGVVVQIALIGQSLGLALVVVLGGAIGFRLVMACGGSRREALVSAVLDRAEYGGVRWAWLLKIVILPIAAGAWVTLAVLAARSMLVGSTLAGGLVVGSLCFVSCLFGVVAIVVVPYLGACVVAAVPPSKRDPGSVFQGTRAAPPQASATLRVKAASTVSLRTTEASPTMVTSGKAKVEARLRERGRPIRKGQGGAEATGMALSHAAPIGTISAEVDYPSSELSAIAESNGQTPGASGAGKPRAGAGRADLSALALERTGVERVGTQGSASSMPVEGSGRHYEVVEGEDLDSTDQGGPDREPGVVNASLSTSKPTPIRVPASPSKHPGVLQIAESYNSGLQLRFVGLEYPLVWRSDDNVSLDVASKAHACSSSSTQWVSFTLALRASRPEDAFGIWLIGLVLSGNVISCELGRFELGVAVEREEGGVFTVALRAAGLEDVGVPRSREERKRLREVLSRHIVVLLRMVRRGFGSVVAPVMTVPAAQVTVIVGRSRNRVHVCPWLLDAEAEMGQEHRLVWRESGEDVTADLGQLPAWMYLVALGFKEKVVLLGVNLQELKALSGVT